MVTNGETIQNSLSYGVGSQQGGETIPPESMYIGDTDKRSSLAKYIDSDNLANDLDEEKLKKIGRRCLEGYNTDENSRKEWLEQTKRAINLSKQTTKEKSFPWRKSANIKLPTILDAAIKFAARAYSEIFKDDKIVKAKSYGNDPTGDKDKRGERVSNYMSWQLSESECEWEPDTDKLLHVLPVVGHMFRKRYYCSSERRSKSELCLPDKICINQQASNLESARRVTHIIDNYSHNDVISNQRSGVWREVDLKSNSGKEPNDTEDLLENDDYYVFLEQHCWLDLDGDSYEEPYIVTIERESAEVVRIVARYDDDGVHENDNNEVMKVVPKKIFTDYIFIPSTDGGYYATGFGQMLEPLTEVANTLINQITDSGTLNNIQGGYLSKEVKIKSGRARFDIGEWKRTTASSEQLKNGVFPLPTSEPSPTLYNLLGLLLDLTKDLASVKDVLAGDSPGMNVPATTVMALIEQGMKTYNAIYKRVYRSLKKEFNQLYSLNFEYLDEEEYYIFLDEEQQTGKTDFEAKSIDVRPVADPNMSTDIQRLARAEALKGTIGQPGVDGKVILRLWFEALKIPEEQIDEIMPQQDPNGMSPEVQALVHDAEKKMADVNVKERELELKERELGIKAFESMTKAIKNIADAESSEAGSQLNIYKQFVDEYIQVSQLNQQQQTEEINNGNTTDSQNLSPSQ